LLLSFDSLVLLGVIDEHSALEFCGQLGVAEFLKLCSQVGVICIFNDYQHWEIFGSFAAHALYVPVPLVLPALWLQALLKLLSGATMVHSIAFEVG